MPEYPVSLLNKVRNAPVDPGCYLFKSSAGKILYIGKAKNLRNRVKSYFSADKSREPKTFAMLKHVQDVEFIITHSEIEALILENTLIKEHRPRYNIFLRDDKTFPYVRITNEPFPRVLITRKKIDDGSKYFGPYTDAGTIREILRIIKKVYTVRTCNYKLDPDTVSEKRIRLCLQYHIHNCDGPCQQLISEKDYLKMIANVEAFLNGHSDNVLQYIRQKMDNAAEDLKFEIAARYRDNLKLLTRYFHKQSVEFSDTKNRDFISLIAEEDIAAVVVIRVRRGKMLSKDTIFLERVNVSRANEAMRTFIQRYYEQSQLIPKEINVNVYPSDMDTLESWLSGMKNSTVRITRPTREEKLSLIRLAEKNAALQLREYIAKKSKRADFIPKSLLQLQADLNLENIPRRIEAFDISNIQGKYSVGSLVTFLNASPMKSQYRRYRIKTVQGINDFAMMAEIVQRRYTRRIKENKTLPDLIVIDGGKGQLNISKQVLDKLEIESIPIIGLAKKLEEVYIPGQREPIILPRDSISLILLRKIRDEAHRFAINYHRKLRGKGSLSSELDQIPGLGPVKKRELWNRFETIKKIRSASVEEISLVPGIGPKLAQIIWDYIHHTS
ncbi:MAG: excinuclease ABC subunit C [Candidatus Neomarinimicrobiota bacterium]|nr:MAG: excinuclease ABC subunit C [Candidatus Neomarinimicrobiota bacterium]